MATLIEILFLGVGALLALGVVVPVFRPRWKGTRIVCGAFGCAGVGLAFMSLGASKLFAHSLSPQQRDWFVYLFFAGWAVAIVGFILNRRRAKRAGMMQHLQTHLIATKR